MTRRPKDIGTADETAVVRALNLLGFPYAERRSLRGSHDCGDITGIPGIMIEVKGGQRGRNASDGQIHRWWTDEVVPQSQNVRADFGFLVTPRAGIGPANAGLWWYHAPVSMLSHLMTGRVWSDPRGRSREQTSDMLVRGTLADATTLLHLAGYGEPIHKHPGTPLCRTDQGA